MQDSVKMLNHKQAVIIITIAAVLFSTSGFLIKIITISPLALASGRSIIAAGVIALYLRKPQFTWSVAQIGGAIALASTQIFFVLATRQTSAANAVFIQYTAPIYVAIFSIWFLREPLRSADWVTMAAVGIGLFLFFGDDISATGRWGNVNALISGLSLAAFMVFMRYQKDGSPVETTLLGNIIVSVIGLPFLLQASPTMGDIGGLFFLGIFQLGIPFIMMAIAIKYLTAVEVILIQTLEPILNPVWVFIVVGEQPSGRALLGGLTVLVAITIRSVLVSRQTRRLTLATTDASSLDG